MTLRTLLTAATLVGAIALPVAIGAPAVAAGARQCLYVNQITSTKADGMRTVYAWTGRHDAWRIDLAADCAPLADGGGKIVLAPRGSGSICGAQDFDLSVVAAGGSQRCFVKGMTRLTPDEASAAPTTAQP